MLMKKVDTGFKPNKELNSENSYLDASFQKDNYTPTNVKRKFEHLSSRNKELLIYSQIKGWESKRFKVHYLLGNMDVLSARSATAARGKFSI